MSPGEAVRLKLIADPAVTALVGTRYYPNRLPQNAVLPAVVYFEVSNVPVTTFDGDAATRITNIRLQLDVYDDDYADTKEAARLIDLVVSNLRSTALKADRLDSRDLYEDATRLHRVSMDFSVWTQG